jgi:hypothetical protein
MSTDSCGEAAVLEGLKLARAGLVDHDFDVPASEALIDAAQQRLGLSFPPSYRRFLREAGCGGVGSEEFYGLVPAGLDARGVPNAIWLYEDARRRGQPPRYFEVYDYGDGTAVALDFDRPSPNGEVPCVAAHAGDWTQTEDVASDFGAFFVAIVREVVDDECPAP